MALTLKDLEPTDWPAFERLFGASGACGGCWCMSWRTAKGEKWDAIKGDKAKNRMQALIEAGSVHGVLAFADGEPVGWCAFNRRPDFPKLDRAPSLACDDAEQVWSIPCFFIHKAHRNQGVGSALLAHAVASLKKHGATIAEGYPTKPAKDGKPMPAAFAWTGTRAMFDRAGFELAGNPDGGKQRVRKSL